MTGGQEKNFSTLGPKLRDNRAKQYYGDKTLQIRVKVSDYFIPLNIQSLGIEDCENSDMHLFKLRRLSIRWILLKS